MKKQKKVVVAKSKSGGPVLGFESDESDKANTLEELLEKAFPDDEEAEGSVKLSVAKFVEILKHASTPSRPSHPAHVVSSSFVGHAEKSRAVFECAFEILVLTDEWTTLPLLPLSVAVTAFDLQTPYRSAGNFCVCDGHHSLISQHSGEYTLQVTLLVPYLSNLGRGLQLDVPYAVKNKLQFVVEGTDDLQLNVDPSRGVTHTVEDVDEEGKKKTSVDCEFPPTKKLKIQWMTKVVEELEAKEEKQMVATVKQNCLYSVGEKLVSTTSVFQYEFVNGSCSLLEVEVDARVRVLHVEGAAIKHWEVNDGKEEIDTDNTDQVGDDEVIDGDDHDVVVESTTHPHQLLRVMLEYGVEGTYNLTVVTELELESTTCRAVVPLFKSRNVTREKGFLGVEARTNVEVDDHVRAGASKISTSELPNVIRSKSTLPNGASIVHAYKFLMPVYDIELDIKKHDDVSVLVASIDYCWIDVTCESEGMCVYRAQYSIRNTQKQYLRVNVPGWTADGGDCEIWSTFVAGSSVKPASGDESVVLIPLKKSGHGDSSFFVELVYAVSKSSMGKCGKLDLKIPSCDVPINRFFLTVRVPEDYLYGEFDGDLSEVQHFSMNVESKFSGHDYQSALDDDQFGSSNVAGFELQQQQVLMSQCEEIEMPVQRKSYRSMGTLPVKVAPLRVGKEFKFERLLVADKEMTVTVSYRRIKRKGFFQRRRIWFSPFQMIFFILSLLVGVGVYMFYYGEI